MKLIGLDVGTKRIGVATADSGVRIAVPNCTLNVNGSEFAEIAKIAKANNTNWFVIGLPRSNEGVETQQSQYVRDFADTLAGVIPGAKIRFQDESLTSVVAESRLKSRKKTGGLFKKEEVDAEAAAIILQDFMESFGGEKSAEPSSEKTAPKISGAEAFLSDTPVKKSARKSQKTAKSGGKSSSTLKKLVIALVCLVLAIAAAGFGSVAWYNSALKPVAGDISCGEESATNNTDCIYIDFTVSEGETVQQIGDNLAAANLIKSSFAFQMYMRTNYRTDAAKAGEYQFRRNMPVSEIASQLIQGSKNPNVFSLTIYPGETVKDVKEDLIKAGFSREDVNAAFKKDYSHPILAGKPTAAEMIATYGENVEPLEGYIFGDTYEFYKDDTVEKIITTTLDALYEVVQGNDLVAKYQEKRLTLYEGITLASIVQKEAKTLEQAHVAQVFLTRLGADKQGILGSDVTTQYALNLVDPTRVIYADNSAALQIDSPYNTRKYAGLTPGPISNPGVSALLAVANPTNTSDYYFLTGDDGTMYYSTTEAQHQQNIRDHCRSLCNAQL